MKELQNKFPAINWLNYLKKSLYSQLTNRIDIFSENSFSQLLFNNSVKITFLNINNFEKYYQLITNTPKRVVANNVFWCYFNKLKLDSKELSSRMVELKNNFLYELNRKKFNYKLPKKCTTKLIKDNRQILNLNMLYLNEYFDKRKSNYTLDMVEDIRVSFQQIIEKVSIIHAY